MVDVLEDRVRIPARRGRVRQDGVIDIIAIVWILNGIKLPSQGNGLLMNLNRFAGEGQMEVLS